MSTHMFARGIVSRFSRIANVDIRAVISPTFDPHGNLIPPCDVLLVHHYFINKENDFSFDVEEIRKRARKVALFLELGSDLADMSFTYQPTCCKPVGAEVVIPLPCEQELLAQTTRPKTNNAVLLDHDYKRPNVDVLCAEIYRVIEPLRDKIEFYQLERFAEKDRFRPDWVRPIPVMPYLDYLRATARMAAFVVTHPGSYNHSIVDMAARGTRVFAPKGCVSSYLSTPMGVTEVDDLVELRDHLDLLPRMPPATTRLKETNDVSIATHIMHNQFLAWKMEDSK